MEHVKPVKAEMVLELPVAHKCGKNPCWDSTYTQKMRKGFANNQLSPLADTEIKERAV